MRLSARLSVFRHNLLSCVVRVFPVLFTLLIINMIFPTLSNAQSTSVQYSNDAYSLITPNVNSDVPGNLHTFTQSILIEVLSATLCSLSGIDFINPEQSCLGIDTKTHKLGYAPAPAQGKRELGGILGIETDMISYLYTPPTSSSIYFQNLADNFGIVKTSHAAAVDQTQTGYGFAGLQPIEPIWKAVLNIAYLFLVLIFVLIGLGIMLRIKIDPRTVMTVQNQLPRIVICILLITFSYAIASLMVDAMWVTTYVGINTLTKPDSQNPQVTSNEKLSQVATRSLYTTPITFVNNVFNTDSVGGILIITKDVSVAGGRLIKEIITDLFSEKGKGCIYWFGIDIGACLGDVFEFISIIVFLLIIFCILIVTLFRIWFALLKAYLFTLMYVIVAPIWIVFGLLPNRPLGFEKWIRSLFVNLAVFPFTIVLFIGARILMEIFKTGGNPADKYIPPLIGNPNLGAFGTILAFGMIMIAPSLIDILKDAMKSPGNKHTSAAVGAALAGGAAAPRAVAGKTMKNLNRRDPYTNEAVGALAVARQKVGNTAVGWIPAVGGKLRTRMEYRQQNRGSMRGFKESGGQNWQQIDKQRSRFKEQLSQDKFNKTEKYANNEAGFQQWQKDQIPALRTKEQALQQRQKGEKGLKRHQTRKEAKQVTRERETLEKQFDTNPTSTGTPGGVPGQQSTPGGTPGQQGAPGGAGGTGGRGGPGGAGGPGRPGTPGASGETPTGSQGRHAAPEAEEESGEVTPPTGETGKNPGIIRRTSRFIRRKWNEGK